ncbi:CG10660 [Drosophila busckii]|uniref:CG10660 n=1 Tax=Drosophila busckii TaxID=30019 RepID=A0A0M4F0M7_DROBS|nr:CG10660 [Drosophila busckii]
MLKNIGFQITIETYDRPNESEKSFSVNGPLSVPGLNVHLIAARHLPSLFGFKIVQGYLVKVKLFPGTKRMDSSIQTNTWPKFNEHFKFPLVPEMRSSMKHGSCSSSRRQNHSQVTGDVSAPDDLFAGQFVVFTVYALLELPAASFNRFNKTYRSLKDKSSNFMQRLVDNSTGPPNEIQSENGIKTPKEKTKKKSENPRDSMPPLTISESRRNIGSVTCYLEPKLFKRNARNGCYTTEELWLPVKDITTTALKTTTNNDDNNNKNLTNSPKGVVELALEVRDLSGSDCQLESTQLAGTVSLSSSVPVHHGDAPVTNNWHRMTAEVKRKIGISNISSNSNGTLMLRVTTTRMRCSNKVKDELEATASAGVYVKTTVFEHGIYVDAWKSPVFYPSLSTKWDATGRDGASICVPLRSLEQLDNIQIRVTLATKLKMGKKLVLGTVLIGNSSTSESALEQLRLVRNSPFNERIATWHCYH